MSISNQLEGIIGDLYAIAPESVLMVGAMLLLITGLIGANGVAIKSLTALILVLSFIATIEVTTGGLVMSNSLYLAENVRLFSGFFLLVTLILLIFPRSTEHSSEFYFLILSLLIGSLFIMKSNSLLVAYLAIELTSFCNYLLTAFSFRKHAFESAMKYLLFGAASSAITLFGIALIYGTEGWFYISSFHAEGLTNMSSEAGLVLFSMGILFKCSVFPMHLWVPATYQNAPCDAVAYMSVVPKIAGFVLLGRIVEVVGLGFNSFYLQFLLALGIATIITGTLSALNQRNVKRLLGNGAVAHSGFFTILVLMASSSAKEAFWFYSLVYGLMNLGIFYIVDQYERNGMVRIEDYQLSKDFIIPVSMTILSISLIGIPPVAGFTAKLFVFSTIYEVYLQSETNLMLTYLIVAVFATVVSLYYYLRVPYQLFLVKNPDRADIKFDLTSKITATLFAVVLLLMFFVPNLVIEIKHWLNP